jgi:elongation factor P
MLNFSDIKIGKVVIFNDKPCIVTKSELRVQPRLAAVKNVMLKDLITGHNYPKNFSASESIEEGNLVKAKGSFMYQNGDELSFMLAETYETVEIPVAMLGGKEVYLKEGLEVDIAYFNDMPITVVLPIKVSLTITSTTDAAKGNTVSNVMKEATTETGLVIKVPQFINEGDRVVMNTETDEYNERDTSK